MGEKKEGLMFPGKNECKVNLINTLENSQVVIVPFTILRLKNDPRVENVNVFTAKYGNHVIKQLKIQ